MKQSVLTLFFLLFFSQLFAQKGEIAGKILDENTKEPIPECHVFIPNTTFQAYTDSTGDFSISGIPIGPWEVFVVKSGFETDSRNLQINPFKKELITWGISQKTPLQMDGIKDSKIKKSKEQFENRFGIGSKNQNWF